MIAVKLDKYKDWTRIVVGEKTRWLRLKNLAVLLELFRRYGKRIYIFPVGESMVVVELSDEASRYVDWMMVMSPRLDKKFIDAFNKGDLEKAFIHELAKVLLEVKK